MAAQADVAPGFYAGAEHRHDEDQRTRAFDGVARRRRQRYRLQDLRRLHASTRTSRSKPATSISARSSGTIEDPFFGNIDFDGRRDRPERFGRRPIPVAEMFALFGKVGFASYDLEFDVSRRRHQRLGQRERIRHDLRRRRRAELRRHSKCAPSTKRMNVEDGDVNMISRSAACIGSDSSLEIGVGLKHDLHGLQVRLSQTPTSLPPKPAPCARDRRALPPHLPA